VASSWILFFSYQDDAWPNNHQICTTLCLSLIAKNLSVLMTAY